MTALEPDFEPTDVDIICARGRTAYNHEGNQRFRKILAQKLDKYKYATSKQEKSSVVNAILGELQGKSRFLRQKSDGKWYQVPDHVAKEKIGQGFRDLLHTRYRSSTKSKVQIRRERRRRQRNKDDQETASSSNNSTGETSGKRGHRASNSCETLEPLPLDESGNPTESLLYDCPFSFATRDECKTPTGDDPNTEHKTEQTTLPQEPGGAVEQLGGQQEAFTDHESAVEQSSGQQEAFTDREPASFHEHSGSNVPPVTPASNASTRGASIPARYEGYASREDTSASHPPSWQAWGPQYSYPPPPTHASPAAHYPSQGYYHYPYSQRREYRSQTHYPPPYYYPPPPNIPPSPYGWDHRYSYSPRHSSPHSRSWAHHQYSDWPPHDHHGESSDHAESSGQHDSCGRGNGPSRRPSW